MTPHAPPHWMDEATRLAKLWTEQQQGFIRMVTGNAGPPAMSAAAQPAAAIETSLRQAQDLWRTSFEKLAALAPQAAGADRPDPGADDRIGHPARLDHPVDER